MGRRKRRKGGRSQRQRTTRIQNGKRCIRWATTRTTTTTAATIRTTRSQRETSTQPSVSNSTRMGRTDRDRNRRIEQNIFRRIIGTGSKNCRARVWKLTVHGLLFLIIMDLGMMLGGLVAFLSLLVSFLFTTLSSHLISARTLLMIHLFLFLLFLLLFFFFVLLLFLLQRRRRIERDNNRTRIAQHFRFFCLFFSCRFC